MTLDPKQRNRRVTACNWACFLVSAFGVVLCTQGDLDWGGIILFGFVMTQNASRLLRAPRQPA
ncbi:hypothetical protein [Paraburkholderia youngii]|uniref:hypothetical protein n=1 Tax=Paraburkholderia youngii TaxID=2782701 RepID=UPI003D1C3C2B